MMGSWGYGNMMGAGLGSWSAIALFTYLVVLVDLVLLGLWLFRQLKKK